MAIMRRSRPINNDDEFQDLGFGSVVAQQSRTRLLNRNGSFNVARRGLRFWTSLSLYHWLLTISWSKFLGITAGLYLLVNIIFATMYFLCGPDALLVPTEHAVDSPFFEAFFFSVQTLATIGYGHITPLGMTPNVLVTIESLVGLLGFALVTGLVFARFSRPTASIIFSKAALISPYRDRTAFEFRIVNRRSSQIIELEAKVIFSFLEESNEGKIRRFRTLDLERHNVTFFPLSWTIVHPIDESSPLYGLSEQDLHDGDAEFLILLTGIDETFSQTVHSRSSYKADEVVWNARFSNVFNPLNDDPDLTIDIDRIHDYRQLE